MVVCTGKAQKSETRVRVAAYIRVSRAGQHADNQAADIEALAAGRGWTITRWIEEEESAWKAGHQRELAAFLKDLRNGKRFDFLIVWALDRTTREGAQKQFAFLHFLSTYKCTLISVREPWAEQSDLTRDLLLAIAAYLAKAESQRRSERIKAGNARKAKEEGWKPGRQVGAKDKPGKRRRRAGYNLRYLKPANILSDAVEADCSSVGRKTNTLKDIES